MLPNEDQIRQAAYARWRRRGWAHGFDRDDWFAAQAELTFTMNYQTIVEYPLDAPGTLILSERPVRYCRFCERTSVQVAFGQAMPLVKGRGTSLRTEGICEECHSGFYDALADQLMRFQDSLATAARERTALPRPRATEVYTLAVFKSLAACALAIMPESELRYFVDALEWVSNPDSDFDGRLLRKEAACLVYSADFLRDRSRISLARRIGNDVPIPYMVFFLARSGVVLQVQLPLCLRDQDLDGRPAFFPERSFVSAEGQSFEQAQARELEIGGRIEA